MLQIRYHCPTDRCVAIIEYAPLEQCGPVMRCPRCGADHCMHLGEAVRTERRLEHCAVCRGTEMFIRKDFPQRIGLLIVVICGVASILLFRINVMYSWLVLGSAVLLDLAIYFIAGTVTTCYACRAEYRGCALNPVHEGFDLATSEKY